jgi:hypothetical protein
MVISLRSEFSRIAVINLILRNARSHLCDECLLTFKSVRFSAAAAIATKCQSRPNAPQQVASVLPKFILVTYDEVHRWFLMVSGRCQSGAAAKTAGVYPNSDSLPSPFSQGAGVP